MYVELGQTSIQGWFEKEWGGQREYIVELKGEEDVYSNSRQIEYSIRTPSPLKHGDVEYTGAHSNSSDTYILCCFFLYPLNLCRGAGRWPLQKNQKQIILL